MKFLTNFGFLKINEQMNAQMYKCRKKNIINKQKIQKCKKKIVNK